MAVIKVGDVLESNFCGLFEVIERIPGKIRIKFLATGYERIYSKEAVHRGEVKDPLDPYVYGVGFFGDGRITNTLEKDLVSKISEYWHSMFKRCYDPLPRYSAYNDCQVHELWHDFQNFAKFYLDNGHPKWELDKDLLIKGNKIYGPDTCLYLPTELNGYIKNNKSRRGEYLIGVSLSYKGDSYIAKCRNDEGKQINLGRYSTEMEAFLKYKEFKESVIKIKGSRWKDLLSAKAYHAVMTYEVLADD